MQTHISTQSFFNTHRDNRTSATQTTHIFPTHWLQPLTHTHKHKFSVVLIRWRRGSRPPPSETTGVTDSLPLHGSLSVDFTLSLFYSHLFFRSIYLFSWFFFFLSSKFHFSPSSSFCLALSLLLIKSSIHLLLTICNFLISVFSNHCLYFAFKKKYVWSDAVKQNGWAQIIPFLYFHAPCLFIFHVSLLIVCESIKAGSAIYSI